MAVIALASASGSPGVTTTALGLALLWPRPVLLVEADPTGGSGAVPVPASGSPRRLRQLGGPRHPLRGAEVSGPGNGQFNENGRRRSKAPILASKVRPSGQRIW